MTPEELVDVADLSYLSDALTREEALDILRASVPHREERIRHLESTGYPCYTTSAGWLGYSDDKLRRLAADAVVDGYTLIELRVGATLGAEDRRGGLSR